MRIFFLEVITITIWWMDYFRRYLPYLCNIYPYLYCFHVECSLKHEKKRIYITEYSNPFLRKFIALFESSDGTLSSECILSVVFPYA